MNRGKQPLGRKCGAEYQPPQLNSIPLIQRGSRLNMLFFLVAPSIERLFRNPAKPYLLFEDGKKTKQKKTGGHTGCMREQR